jgi:cation transport protein ChaC
MIDRWIFAYGSLMWNPCFTYAERCHGTLHGYERSFCIRSTHYRGTPSQPGLTLGLAPGDKVEGYVYLISGHCWDEVYDAVLKREQATGSYIEQTLPVTLRCGDVVEAVVFIANCASSDWAGCADVQSQAEQISRSAGVMGPNIEYLSDLVRTLDDADIHDPYVKRLYEAAFTAAVAAGVI